MRTLLALCGAAGLLLASQTALRQEREKMVKEQIEPMGIRNPKVLEALRTVERHRFVPRRLESQAYEDHPLPIGYGATISQPYIVAYMTQLLDPQPADKVLEVGTGSGYQAAILSKLVNHVYSVEIVPELASAAKTRLERLGYGNVTVKQGDGYRGWPEHAPFDKIILTAAPPKLPEALTQQLKRGGRLVAPVGPHELAQNLVVVEKHADGSLSEQQVLPVRFVPMVPEKR